MPSGGGSTRAKRARERAAREAAEEQATADAVAEPEPRRPLGARAYAAGHRLVYVVEAAEVERGMPAYTPERRLKLPRGAPRPEWPLALAPPPGRVPSPDSRTELLPGVRVRPETAEALRAWAAERGVGVAALAAELIEAAIHRRR